jgi:hypothetical protein
VVPIVEETPQKPINPQNPKTPEVKILVFIICAFLQLEWRYLKLKPIRRNAGQGSQ